MARFLDRYRTQSQVQNPVQPTCSHTVAEYRGRHANADLRVREERTTRHTRHKDYDEFEIREVREARTRVWHNK